MKRKATVKGEGAIVEGYRRAVVARLRYARLSGDASGKIHLMAQGRELMGKEKPYALCKRAFERAAISEGRSLESKELCKECKGRVERLALWLVANHRVDLWALAAWAPVSLTAAQVKEALDAPTVWAEFEPSEPQALPLPEEFLPKGSGQLIQRGWDHL